MNPPATARLHATIHGRVQGVGFRYFVVQTARPLGLPGWVRNRRTGTVEVVAEGARPDLEQFLNRLRLGPPSALVTDIELEWLPASGEFNGFESRATV